MVWMVDDVFFVWTVDDVLGVWAVSTVDDALVFSVSFLLDVSPQPPAVELGTTAVVVPYPLREEEEAP